MAKTSPQLQTITTAAAPTTTATAPAGTAATETSAAGPTAVAPTPTLDMMTGADMPTPVAPTTTVAIPDLCPTDPAADRANVAGLAVLRLGKGLLGAAVTAGRELASIEREMGTEFTTCIAAKTMLSVGEARTLINFAARAGLQPEGLTAAAAVPLSRVLGAVALLGNTFQAETEAAAPRHEGVGAQTE